MCALYALHVKNIQLIYCYTSDTVGLQAYGSWLIICIQVTNWKQDRISLHMTPYPHIIRTPRRDRNHLSYPQHTEPVHRYMCWHEDITQRTGVIPYRRFGTTCRSHHSTLRNIAEERRSHLHRGGSLKSRVC